MSSVIDLADKEFAAVATYITSAIRIEPKTDYSKLTTAQSIIASVNPAQRHERKQYFYYDTTAHDELDIEEVTKIQNAFASGDFKSNDDVKKLIGGTIETNHNDFPRAMHLDLVGKSLKSTETLIGDIPFERTRAKIFELLHRTHNDNDTTITSVVVVSQPRFISGDGEALPKIFKAAMHGIDGLNVDQYTEDEKSIQTALRSNVQLIRNLN